MRVECWFLTGADIEVKGGALELVVLSQANQGFWIRFYFPRDSEEVRQGTSTLGHYSYLITQYSIRHLERALSMNAPEIYSQGIEHETSAAENVIFQ
jgi:hypothetical protein